MWKGKGKRNAATTVEWCRPIREADQREIINEICCAMQRSGSSHLAVEDFFAEEGIAVTHIKPSSEPSSYIHMVESVGPIRNPNPNQAADFSDLRPLMDEPLTLDGDEDVGSGVHSTTGIHNPYVDPSTIQLSSLCERHTKSSSAGSSRRGYKVMNIKGSKGSFCIVQRIVDKISVRITRKLFRKSMVPFMEWLLNLGASLRELPPEGLTRHFTDFLLQGFSQISEWANIMQWCSEDSKDMPMNFFMPRLHARRGSYAILGRRALQLNGANMIDISGILAAAAAFTGHSAPIVYGVALLLLTGGVVAKWCSHLKLGRMSSKTLPDIDEKFEGKPDKKVKHFSEVGLRFSVSADRSLLFSTLRTMKPGVLIQLVTKVDAWLLILMFRQA